MPIFLKLSLEFPIFKAKQICVKSKKQIKFNLERETVFSSLCKDALKKRKFLAGNNLSSAIWRSP